jgi:hypothetical protein
MAEISPPRIESISDPNSGSQDRSQDQPAPKPPAKQNAAAKPAAPRAPEVSAPEEEDQHQLDEMA